MKNENPPRAPGGHGTLFRQPQGSRQQTGPEKKAHGPMTTADHGAGDDDQNIIQDLPQ